MTILQVFIVIFVFTAAATLVFLASIPTAKELQDDCTLKGRITYPPKRLTDPSFEYRSSVHTDLSETFRKARKSQEVV